MEIVPIGAHPDATLARLPPGSTLLQTRRGLRAFVPCGSGGVRIGPTDREELVRLAWLTRRMG